MKKKTTKSVKTPSSQLSASKMPIDAGNYSVVMNSDELFSIIQILSFSKDIFLQMSTNAAKDGDDEVSKVYSARSQLSMILYAKFKDIVKIGEPTSREVH